MHSITQEELLQYMYGETSIKKTVAIKAALQSDWNLREQYELLLAAQQNLEKVTLAPRKKAVDFILNYASKQVKEFTEQ
jgi:predicted Rdx family selenoprotein